MDADGSFAWVVSQLRHPVSSNRVRAVRSLISHGPEAINPLCLALRDRDIEVRAAAAAALGEIGDKSAVGPLLVALRDTFALHKPWMQYIVGVLLLAGIPLLGATAVILGLAIIAVLIVVSGISIQLFYSFSVLPHIWEIGLHPLQRTYEWLRYAYTFFGHRKRRNEICMTIADALVKIAERSPTPQLCDAIPDLNAISHDFIQQSTNTRETARRVKSRIAALTELMKNLPMSADTTVSESKRLPRLAKKKIFEDTALPRSIKRRNQ